VRLLSDLPTAHYARATCRTSPETELSDTPADPSEQRPNASSSRAAGITHRYQPVTPRRPGGIRDDRSPTRLGTVGEAEAGQVGRENVVLKLKTSGE
jgi:hypothetical protein